MSIGEAVQQLERSDSGRYLLHELYYQILDLDLLEEEVDRRALLVLWTEALTGDLDAVKRAIREA